MEKKVTSEVWINYLLWGDVKSSIIYCEQCVQQSDFIFYACDFLKILLCSILCSLVSKHPWKLFKVAVVHSLQGKYTDLTETLSHKFWFWFSYSGYITLYYITVPLTVASRVLKGISQMHVQVLSVLVFIRLSKLCSDRMFLICCLIPLTDFHNPKTNT